MEKLLEALARATGAMENPKFDSTNPHFKSKFASLAACEAVVRPRLAEQSLMYRQTCEVDDAGRAWVLTVAYGAGGEAELSRVPLVMVGNDPQKQGSALTYAKRYGLCAAFGLAGEEDDDGNAASERPETPQKPRRAAPKASVPPKAQSAPVASPDGPQGLSQESLAALRQGFVNYRDAMRLPSDEALQRLLSETGLTEFGSGMTEQEAGRAMAHMAKEIARVVGGAVEVDG